MKQRWLRRGKLSGPCNVLDDRYEVVRRGSRWIVVDHAPGLPPKVVASGYRTMKMAKEVAELVARGHW
jgi:hypothetical protein